MDKTVRLAVDGEKAKKWAKNILFFTAPALIVFLEALRQGIPLEKAYPLLVFALYGLIADALRKFVQLDTPPKA